MLFFLLCVALLVIGYFTYGVLVERIFGVKAERPTPAVELADGVDYMSMPTWKVFLIQLLDIAGIGPIFGPILGALYGPAALLWIVIGCIFAGAVHDYFSGMLSVRNRGKNVPEIVGNALGNSMRWVMRVFSVVLLIFVGVVFVTAPAKLLASITGVGYLYLVGAIFAYYFLATILPINQIIGRLYPIFGLLLLIMSFGVIGGLAFSGKEILPDLDFFKNTHPEQLPMWPLMFITIACGAVSGFHSTQSPLMARCLRDERKGRLVFYGAMLAEGIIALVWATVGLSFYDSPEALQATVTAGTASMVVHDSCIELLGGVGGILAFVGVVILPITSGDTAFRSCRLIIADTIRLKQSAVARRLLIAIPLFVLAGVLTFVKFGVIWRYFGWSNQTLAALVLWSAAAILARAGKFHWVATAPAVFMTAVCATFSFTSPYFFGLAIGLSTVLGALVAVLAFVAFLVLVNGRDVADAEETLA